MAKELRTRAVSKEAFRAHLKKAIEFHQAMLDCYDKKLWNACVANAVHCAINCCDAMSVFYLGFRHAGERHADAIELLRQIKLSKREMDDNTKHFLELIRVKSIAEYEDRLMDEFDAAAAKKHCERFYVWISGKIGKA